jgi:hypothetical protein
MALRFRPQEVSIGARKIAPPTGRMAARRCAVSQFLTFGASTMISGKDRTAYQLSESGNGLMERDIGHFGESRVP